MSPASAPAGVRFEHRTDDGAVLGIGTPAPRLSWYLPDAPDGFRQHAYQVEISRSAGPVELTTVTSAEQILVPWPGAPLAAREPAQVRVRVCGADDDWSEWSAPAVAERGIDDWTARFISPVKKSTPSSSSPIGFRHSKSVSR